jgi:hypothetical protein
MAAAALGAVASERIKEAERKSPEVPTRGCSDKGLTGLELQAREEARRCGPWTEDPAGNPILIEAELHVDLIDVAMPDGTTVEFRLEGAWAAPCPVVVHIYPAVSRFANVFRRSCEGVHPFLGRAARVERRGA